MPTSWLGSWKPSAAAFIESCVAARLTWSRRSAQRASDPLQGREAERASGVSQGEVRRSGSDDEGERHHARQRPAPPDHLPAPSPAWRSPGEFTLNG